MREITPKETNRAQAYDLWMKAPNPMVTFFKTIDVTRLVRISKKKRYKFKTASVRFSCRQYHRQK